MTVAGVTIRECPACGNTEIESSLTKNSYERVFFCPRPECQLQGPVGEDLFTALTAWNKLPRYKWIPVSLPPVVPEGDHAWFQVWDGMESSVKAYLNKYDPYFYTYSRVLFTGWFEYIDDKENGGWKPLPSVTHWMPRTPGPDITKEL